MLVALKPLLSVVIWISAYFVAWTASYILTWVSRGDDVRFTYYFDYLIAAWTFRGLEGVPQFMLVISILIFIPVAVLLVLLKRAMRRRAEQHNAV